MISWPLRCVTRIFFLFLLKGLGVRVAYVIYRRRHLAVSLNCFLRGSNHLQANFKTNIHTGICCRQSEPENKGIIVSEF